MSHAFQSHISREEINALPVLKYEGPIRLVSTDAQVREILPLLMKEPLLGFDTETKACFRKGESYLPSLVQLAAGSAVYLIQLGGLGDLSWFDGLFANADIIKAGVSLQYDVRKLKDLRSFAPEGFVDLAKLADRAGIKNNGLRGLAAVVLGGRITKGAQRSDWSRSELSSHQILYAATDAWVSREIYLKLSSYAQFEVQPGEEAAKLPPDSSS